MLGKKQGKVLMRGWKFKKRCTAIRRGCRVPWYYSTINGGAEETRKTVDRGEKWEIHKYVKPINVYSVSNYLLSKFMCVAKSTAVSRGVYSEGNHISEQM